jgi:hypothetical protein
MSSRTIQTALILSILLLPSAILADVPLNDWSAPATWRPAGEISAMAVFIPFRPVQPCRVYDSRNFTILTGGTSRTIPMDGVCSLPAGARAYSVHITAFGSTASSSYGFITAWPTGSAQPTVSTMNFLGGSQTSTAAVVPAGSGNDINIFTTMTTHFVVDVNGYYAENLGTGDYFGVSGDYAGFGLAFANNTASAANSSSFRGLSSGAGRVYGVSGEVSSGTAEAAGVRGLNHTTSSFAYGVLGHLTAPAGGLVSAAVRGQSDSTGGGGIGVWGSHAGSGYGGYFTSVTGYAVLATTGASNAVRGTSSGDAIYGGTTASTGRTYGVWGHTSNDTDSAAGVLGTDNDGKFNPGHFFGSVGVLGLAQAAPGVLGVSTFRGVQGSFGTVSSGTFTFQTGGVLGLSSTVGVHAFGNITASGTKSFVEPHPSQAGAVINYIALEGPEAGTYFRGRGRFVGGRAVIAVPEHFRFTTVDDGLTVQITPIGDFAQVAVTSTNLNSITVKSSMDVEFYYQVNGVRQAHPRHRPIHQDEDLFFVPMSADDRLENVYGEENRRRLVANGTFNEDGSVNLPTAERLGWAQQWREREAAERKASEAAAASTEGQQQ